MNSKTITYIISTPFTIIGLVIVIFILAYIIFSNTFISPQEKIIKSVGSNYECINYCSAGFRDYTDYYVFSYKKPKIEDAEKFQKVDDTSEIEIYINDFNSWADNHRDEEFKSYDFDTDIIDSSDYYYIFDKSTEDDLYSKYDYYDIYLFDSQTELLYYFHNDIWFIHLIYQEK